MSFVQFLALLWHRGATAVQHHVASMPFPAWCSADGLSHGHAEIQPQQ